MKHFAILPIIALAACAPQPGPVKRQMIGLLEKFDRWDYNGDGYLDEARETVEEIKARP